MREYRFRGKSIYSHKWVEGSLIHVDENGTLEHDNWPIVPKRSYTCILQDEAELHPIDWPYLDCSTGCIDGYLTPVDPDTVGQFTGLADKNGTKIFEGDIIKTDNGTRSAVSIVKYGHHEPGMFYELVEMYAGYRPKELVFGLFGESNTGEQFFMADSPKCIEVIGNKWDNPELLEVE